MKDILTPFPLINAVLMNLQDGVVFRNGENAEASFVLHKSGFSYTSGRENDYRILLHSIITSEKVPGYFHVYDPAPEFIETCRLESEAVNIKIRKRVQLKFTNTRVVKKYSPVPEYKTEKINAGNFDLLSVFDLSLENKFWRSKTNFLTNGFGIIVTNSMGAPVSICYTACVANNTAEIDVATMTGYQNKGFAKIAVGAFIESCIEKNIIANWDCFEDNEASLKTAKSLGFTSAINYSFLSIFNKKK